MRRYSDTTCTTEETSKIVTKENAMVVGKKPTRDDCIDEVEYCRCMESVMKEMKRPQHRHEVIEKLLELTYKARRQKINGALVETRTLLNEYPFFKIKKWVSSMHIVDHNGSVLRTYMRSMHAYACSQNSHALLWSCCLAMTCCMVGIYVHANKCKIDAIYVLVVFGSYVYVVIGSYLYGIALLIKTYWNM